MEHRLAFTVHKVLGVLRVWPYLTNSRRSWILERSPPWRLQLQSLDHDHPCKIGLDKLKCERLLQSCRLRRVRGGVTVAVNVRGHIDGAI